MHLCIPCREQSDQLGSHSHCHAATPPHHMGSAVKRQAQFPEQARHLLHELADPAAALRAILGNRGCRAAQTQPRGLQRGPRSDGFLQAYVHKSLISAAILLPRQRGEGIPRAFVCDVYAVGSLWDQLFTALRISLAHVACTPSRLQHCQGCSYPAAVDCGQLVGAYTSEGEPNVIQCYIPV